MPRRSILTERQHSALFDLPTDEASMLLHYTLADDDLEHINARRRPENRVELAELVVFMPCGSRSPKHGKSSLPAVAPGTAGVHLLVPSGLSYYASTNKKHLFALSEPQNSPGTKQLVRGRRGSLACGMSCIRGRQGPVAPPSLHGQIEQ
jgi:hypothetical protein